MRLCGLLLILAACTHVTPHNTSPEQPTAKSTTLRISDGSDCITSYSYWPSFNKDNTYFHIRCDGKALLYKFDPTAFKVISFESLFVSAGNWEDSIWSGVDPDILFTHDLTNLWSYNVATKEYQKIWSIEPGHHIFQMSKSLDDNIFAWTEKDAEYKTIGYLVYNRDEDRIIYRSKTSELDEVQLDKWGLYLVVKTGNETPGQTRVIIVDLATGKTTPLSGGDPDFACGHSDNGFATTVGIDNYGNGIQERSLLNPNFKRTILSFGNDWTFAAHISMLSDDGSALVSTYSTSQEPGLYHNELFLLSMNGEVKHLGPHGSLYSSYYDAPRANISRDGKFVVYTSNMEDGRHVFIKKVN